MCTNNGMNNVESLETYCSKGQYEKKNKFSLLNFVTEHNGWLLAFLIGMVLFWITKQILNLIKPG